MILDSLIFVVVVNNPACFSYKIKNFCYTSSSPFVPVLVIGYVLVVNPFFTP